LTVDPGSAVPFTIGALLFAGETGAVPATVGTAGTTWSSFTAPSCGEDCSDPLLVTVTVTSYEPSGVPAGIDTGIDPFAPPVAAGSEVGGELIVVAPELRVATPDVAPPLVL
jgi:hypothetical protein